VALDEIHDVDLHAAELALVARGHGDDDARANGDDAPSRDADADATRRGAARRGARWTRG
jgi:hypothetical protein